MKLAYVDFCGFRGYRKPVRIDFADGFTVIDGRNGVGKSTIFDAVEFALTGTILKYGSAKAAGETVADYIWWTGEGPSPTDRYVEVGFRAGGETVPIRRTQLVDADPKTLSDLVQRLCDASLSPPRPLEQLCAASIIRDELIAALSLDLTETERYALLRDAIGATDADAWIERGSKLVSAAKKRVTAAEQEVGSANSEIAVATRRVDEIRASAVEEVTVASAASRLRAFARTAVPNDQLAVPVRAEIADALRQIEELDNLAKQWIAAENARARLTELEAAIAGAERAKTEAQQELDNLRAHSSASTSSMLARQAHDLASLAALGRRLGLIDGHCPLCAAEQDQVTFARGIELVEGHARRLDQEAAEQVQREQATTAAEEKLESLRRTADTSVTARLFALSTLERFETQRNALGFASTSTLDDVRRRQRDLNTALNQARDDLRTLDAFSLSTGLERAARGSADARGRLARAEERLGRAKRAEHTAQTLHHAAQRAAGETLDQRLERVLPLMVELYRRLRPHPIWREIEYSVRGDVRRFLKLQVGDHLNPQFIFSSGQRRATGLAFLLSINLSLAWSGWRTILLDDPVQHVDDFRSVHLAEVLAQLCEEGMQIICAVEDAALADLLCRRLPVKRVGDGRRISLGTDSDGALGKLSEGPVPSLVYPALVTQTEQHAGVASGNPR